MNLICWKIRCRHFIDNLNCNEMFVYPAEGVYGLGGNPFSSNVAQKISSYKSGKKKKHKSKSQNKRKGFILLVDSLEELFKVTNLSSTTKKEVAKKVNDYHMDNRPLTLIAHRSVLCPSWLATDDTIAIRVVHSDTLNQLTGRLTFPLVSTSFNIPGTPPTKKTWRARVLCRHRGQQIPLLVNSNFSHSGVSAIYDLVNQRWVRN